MTTLSHSKSRRLYSWWWDSHISPKNSKWLQENLTDMDTKVKAMIKLIEEDADSFAKRAEMYYEKRPELIALVEEFYRAYRALAERYDHATGGLRQAHQIMAEAFPDQVPPALTEDSAAIPSAHEVDPQMGEMPRPACAVPESDDFHREVLQVSGLEVPPNFKFSEESSGKGLNCEMEGTQQNLHDKISHLANENRCLQIEVLAESDRVVKAESEVHSLKKALAAMQAEKEAVLLQYQQTLQKLSDLEGELNHRSQREDSSGPNEQARNAETEIQTLKQKLVKLEAERDAGFLQHEEYLQRISNLEFTISQAQEESKGLNGRVAEAEIETQYLNRDLPSLWTENDAGLTHYKQYMEKICDLVNKLSLAEEEAKSLSKRADRAETEVKKLEKAIAKLNGEKETVALQYEDCLGKISKLENELSCARQDVARLTDEQRIGAAKQKSAEEKHVVLEVSNKSLRLQAENLSKKVAMKDQELSAKREELEKLKNHVRSEHLSLVRVEAALQTLQDLYAQSQQEQRALLELKNGLQMLKDLEMCKQSLEEEIRRAWDENSNLNELNLSSSIAMKSLRNEILGLRNLKERLEEEVASQMSQNNACHQEIYHLKQEIMGLGRRHRALMEQVESVGLDPDCIGLLVKDLQDENSKLKMICQEDREEKEALLKKLANTAKVLKKNATLAGSLSDMNGALEASREDIKALQESCHFLQGERSRVAAEKSALSDQFQIVNENVQQLLEKNTSLESSLSAASAEIEDLRAKSKSLEELCKLLNNENSNLFSERSTLVIQLENLQLRLENLEKMFSELEAKYASLEKERESTHSQVEELRISLDLAKQDWASCAMLNEARLTSLEKSVRLLREQSGRRKKEFEEELDKVMNSQFEIFILKSFMQDMEEKAYSLLIERHKHADASKFAEEPIFDLKSENIERQAEAEMLSDEIGKLRMGIHAVFQALEIGPDRMCKGEIQNAQILIHHALGNIEDMKCSFSQLKDDEQRLWVENSILLTLLKHLRCEGSEIELKKKMLEQKFDTVTLQLVKVQNEKHGLVEMIRQLKSKLRKGDQQDNKLKAEMESLCVKHEDLQRLYFELQEEYCETLEENRSLVKKVSAMEEETDLILGEILALCNLSMVFESFVIEKSIELEVNTEELHNLNAINRNLEREINVLREKLEMKETGKLLLNDSVEQLDKGFHGVRDINDQLSEENTTVKEFLRQKELGVDKLEESTRVAEPNQERIKKKDLENPASDAQKLSSLQTTVQELRRKLEANKESKKAKNVDFEMVKEQLEKLDTTVVQLLGTNDQPLKNIDESSPSCSNKKSFVELEEAEKIEKMGVSQEAQIGSERIEKLQLEVQKIQRLLVEAEDEKKSKWRNQFSGDTISTILSGFIQNSRRSRETPKKTCICGCLKPSTKEDGN